MKNSKLEELVKKWGPLLKGLEDLSMDEVNITKMKDQLLLEVREFVPMSKKIIMSMGRVKSVKGLATTWLNMKELLGSYGFNEEPL